MDYQYAFRHAQKDRLEDAGVIQYRPNDGFRVFGHQRQTRRKLVQRFNLIIAIVINLLKK